MDSRELITAKAILATLEAVQQLARDLNRKMPYELSDSTMDKLEQATTAVRLLVETVTG